MLKRAFAAMLLATLTACNPGGAKQFANERDNKDYRTAMSDFNAGRIDQAAKGLMKVLAENPANSSARFQLACIQFERQRDYAAAYCNFREYLAQKPKSDKAEVARQFLAHSEEELARTLAKKYHLGEDGVAPEDVEKLHSALKTERQAREKHLKDLGDATRKIASLEADRKRMVALMKTDADPEEAAPTLAPPKRDVKALLEENDEDDEGDRIRMSKDVAALRLDEAKENEASSSLLPPPPKKRPAPVAAAKSAEEREASEPPHEKKPDAYIVQEGDTLTRIALRFYGRKSAWSKIRDANKAVITTDGRVRKGDVIRLP